MTQKAKCPICKTRPPVQRYRPFCSRGCSATDLNRWLDGRYAVPIDEPSETEED